MAGIFGRFGDDGAPEEEDRTEYSSRSTAEAMVSRYDPGQREQIVYGAFELQTPRRAVDTTGLSRGDAGGN